MSMRRRYFFAGLVPLALLSAALAFDAVAQTRPGKAAVQRPGRWELLGTQKVGFAVDRDVVRVGRQDGRFRAIKLRVRDNDLELRDLKVVYGNGTTEDFVVRRSIRRGGETRTIDLGGSTRFVREVQLTYRSRPSFRGQASVEVWGLH
ncbi:MAG: hypothetical protein SFW09_11065 [Hyphomicrobiaceae bacterium]|nr:hypothetical protein [Hyphomicrobiaceae bacterium]